MNIDYLSEFVYLADTLSFRETAQHFYVSRSVISRHVAALEEQLGARLLERDGHTVSLTEQGSVFYREAKVIISDYANALKCVHLAGEGSIHTVRIGYLRNACRPFIVKFVRFMKHRYPSIRLMLTCMEYDHLCRAVDERKVDVAFSIFMQPTQPVGYGMSSIYNDQFYAVMDAENPFSDPDRSITFDDIMGSRVILPDSFAYSGLSDFIDRAVDQRPGLVPYAYCRDMDTMLVRIQVENCIGLHSGYNCWMFDSDEEICVKPVDEARLAFSVNTFYQENLPGHVLSALTDGFAHCRSIMDSWDDQLPSGVVVPTLG